MDVCSVFLLEYKLEQKFPKKSKSENERAD